MGIVAPSFPARWQKTPFAFLPAPSLSCWESCADMDILQANKMGHVGKVSSDFDKSRRRKLEGWNGMLNPVLEYGVMMAMAMLHRDWSSSCKHLTSSRIENSSHVQNAKRRPTCWGLTNTASWHLGLRLPKLLLPCLQKVTILSKHGTYWSC